MLRWLKQYPEITSVNVSQNDGPLGACECEKCAAIVTAEGAQHGPILRFVNAIADTVAKDYPDKYVDTFAYDYSTLAPKVTKPRDNVIIRLCHGGCYFHGVGDEELSARFKPAIEGWRKIAKHIWVWHYAVNFGHYLAPNPNLNGLAKDIKYYTSHGIDGLMVQGNYQSPGGELAELRQYLVAQLMWDPTQDPMVIRTDFCRGYYGPSADSALEFLALMDKLGEKAPHSYAGWDPTQVAPPEFVTASLAILNRALSKAPDDIHRNRVEKLLMPMWYMQLQWPDRYGVPKEQCREVLARFKRVVEANGIVNSSEAFEVRNDGTAPLYSNMPDFLAAKQTQYAADK